MTDPTHYLFWITSRAAGTTALVLASASVALGLTMATRLLKGYGGDLRKLHETLSLSVIVAIAVHALALLGDSYLHPNLLDVSIPFLITYRTLATSVGIIAGWALLILGLSYYLRRRIGYRRWRTIHSLTVVAWLAALVHTFTAGTDAGQPWFIALILVTAAPALALLVTRLSGLRLRVPTAAMGQR